MSVAFHGVSGAGFSTTVLPVARAWPNLARVTSNGKFQGAMAPTTPTGSLTTRRVLVPPRKSAASGSRVSHSNSSMSLIGIAEGVAQRCVSWGP